MNPDSELLACLIVLPSTTVGQPTCPAKFFELNLFDTHLQSAQDMFPILDKLAVKVEVADIKKYDRFAKNTR